MATFEFAGNKYEYEDPGHVAKTLLDTMVLRKHSLAAWAVSGACLPNLVKVRISDTQYDIYEYAARVCYELSERGADHIKSSNDILAVYQHYVDGLQQRLPSADMVESEKNS